MKQPAQILSTKLPRRLIGLSRLNRVNGLGPVLRRASAILLLAMAGFVTACETKVEVPTYADITFSHLEPLRVSVASIETLNTYTAPLTSDHIEGEFPVDIAKTAMRWAEDRLSAVGSAGAMTLTVSEASVVETKLEKKKGLTGVITTDQDFRYDAKLTVTLSAEDPSSQTASATTVSVQRSQTVPEDLSYNEREEIWYQMTEKMMADLNAQLEKAINDHMVYFLAL